MWGDLHWYQNDIGKKLKKWHFSFSLVFFTLVSSPNTSFFFIATERIFSFLLFLIIHRSVLFSVCFHIFNLLLLFFSVQESNKLLFEQHLLGGLSVTRSSIYLFHPKSDNSFHFAQPEISKLDRTDFLSLSVPSHTRNPSRKTRA